MGNAVGYLVVCACSGSIEPVAYLNDDRPVGGALRIDAPVGQMMVVGPQLSDGPEPRESADEWAAMFTEHNVTRIHWNRWGDDHITWVVRCMSCNRQAQLRQDTYARLADELAKGRDALPLIPAPDPHSAEVEERHLIQLGVLCDRVSQLQG